MSDIPSDIGQVAKMIASFEIGSVEDVHRLADLCRAFQVEAADVMGYAEFELYAALRYIDHGRGRRARQVVRPLKHALSLNLLAARRSASVWPTFRKLFAEELSRNQRSGRGERRKFDWQEK